MAVTILKALKINPISAGACGLAEDDHNTLRTSFLSSSGSRTILWRRMPDQILQRWKYNLEKSF